MVSCAPLSVLELLLPVRGYCLPLLLSQRLVAFCWAPQVNVCRCARLALFRGVHLALLKRFSAFFLQKPSGKESDIQYGLTYQPGTHYHIISVQRYPHWIQCIPISLSPRPPLFRSLFPLVTIPTSKRPFISPKVQPSWTLRCANSSNKWWNSQINESKAVFPATVNHCFGIGSVVWSMRTSNGTAWLQLSSLRSHDGQWSWTLDSVKNLLKSKTNCTKILSLRSGKKTLAFKFAR